MARVGILEGGLPASSTPLPEREVVRDLEQPASQIGLWSPQPQVVIERQEGFLNDVFGFVGPQAERTQIAKERRGGAVEERQHLLFNRSIRGLDLAVGDEWQTKGGIGFRGH